jgi:septum formation protein
MKPELILASQSPRRKQLLTEAGFRFRIDAPDDSVEKAGLCSRCSPQELVMQAAFLKAAAIANRNESGLVLAADTVAVCGSETLGKPTSREHAKSMLALMSGKEHRVLTGVCLRFAGTDRLKTWLEETVLTMDQLSEEDLEQYLDTDDWIGKAGAFGFQDGLDWVHIKQGLASNVVGLPIERLPGWFAEIGFDDVASIKCSD